MRTDGDAPLVAQAIQRRLLLDLRSSVFVPKPRHLRSFGSSMSNDVPENDPAISSFFFLPPDLPAFLGLVREMTLIAIRKSLCSSLTEKSVSRAEA